MGKLNFPPRLIRMRDAPGYVGLDRHNFKIMVRPYLTEIPMGERGIAFDRLEIDQWVEDHIRRNGRCSNLENFEDEQCQNATKCQGYVLGAVSGKLKNDVSMSKVAGSVKAREKLAALRQKNI